MQIDTNAVLRVDLGCGTRKEEGFIGVDKEAYPNVDIVADLNEDWPFPENSVTLFSSFMLLPHMDDFYHFFNEAWRCLQYGGQFRLITPYGENEIFIENPDHKLSVVPGTFARLDPLAPAQKYDRKRSKPWKLQEIFSQNNGHIEVLLQKRMEDKSY